MDKNLKRLIAKAAKVSRNTRWGYYPMAPSIGLSEKEIRQHGKAIEAHGLAYEALIKEGFEEEARRHQRAIENHSLVVQRNGNF